MANPSRTLDPLNDPIRMAREMAARQVDGFLGQQVAPLGQVKPERATSQAELRRIFGRK
jgi:hypothetical protein